MTGELVDDVADEMDESHASETVVDQDAIATRANDVDPDDRDRLTGWGVSLEGDTADVDNVDEAPEIDVEVIAAAQRETLGLLLVVEDEPGKVRKARAAVAKTAAAAAAAQLAIAKARDVVADAAGAVRAAEAKATEYLENPKKTLAQSTAADVALAKAQRAHARAVGALERAEAAAAVADDVAVQARTLLAHVLAQAQAEALAAALEDEEQEADAPPEPLFETLPQFVEQIIAVLYADEFAISGPRRWCAQWWRHPEVVFRLEALWRAFEHLRLDPTTGMSVFLRDHADPHMAQIMSADGPLRRCKPDDHKEPLARLILVEPQDGLYTPENA